jgi:RNA polymerase sigma factor (TIGR02999 family)
MRRYLQNLTRLKLAVAFSGSIAVSEFTKILNALQRGESRSTDEWLPLVYEELRQLAAAKMAHELPGQTLQPTALVHEAWLRLGHQDQHWQNRAHFFGAAAEAMRRILIDNARRKRALRHGGGQRTMTLLDDAAGPAADPDDQLLAVHEALEKLEGLDKLKADLVKLRYFAGMTIKEAAEVLNISEPTAKRYWAFARAWLYREITEST